MDSNNHEDLWREYWADRSSVKALEALVRALVPVVLQVLERISIRLPPQVATDDLLQAGLIGLCEAIERFDPAQKTAFRTFAGPRIRGSIMDELRREDHMSRSDRARLRKVEAAIDAMTRRSGRLPTDAELAAEVGLKEDELAELMRLAQPFLSLDDVVVPGGDGNPVALRDVIAETVSRAPDEASEHLDMLTNLRAAFRMLADRERKVLYLYYFESL